MALDRASVTGTSAGLPSSRCTASERAAATTATTRLMTTTNPFGRDAVATRAASPAATGRRSSRRMNDHTAPARNSESAYPIVKVIAPGNSAVIQTA